MGASLRHREHADVHHDQQTPSSPVVYISDDHAVYE